MSYDLDIPIFQISIAAHASGWETEQLRQILARASREAKLSQDMSDADAGLANLGMGAGDYLAKSSMSGGKRGRATLYTLRSIYRFAIAERLVKAGFQIAQATLCAIQFTDFGSEDRAPGTLYEHPDFTVLCCFSGHSQVLRVGRKDSVFAWPHMHIGAPPEFAVTTIWMNALLDTVNKNLDDALQGAGE